jgi:hypothetical protein
VITLLLMRAFTEPFLPAGLWLIPKPGLPLMWIGRPSRVFTSTLA